MGLVILLIMAGILLLLAEILIVPGIGIAGILGILSLIGSSYFAYNFLGTTPFLIVTAFNTITLAVLTVIVLREKTWKKFELDTAIDTKANPEVLLEVGMKGKAITRLSPIGSARIMDKQCEVTSEEGMLDAGTEIEVSRLENNKVYVKKIINN